MKCLCVIFAVTVVLQSTFLISDAKPTSYPIREMPKSCMNQTFCTEKPETYPQETIDELLKNLTVTIIRETEIADRDQNFPDEFCETEDLYNPIYEILDSEDNLRWVIQSENKFEQVIAGANCKSAEPVNKDLLRNVTGTCQNKVIDYNFLVLSHDMTTFDVVQSKDGIPVGCGLVIT